MLKPKPPDRNLIAVVDCETTGLSASDRIVELAIMFVDITDDQLNSADHFTTLINPECDVGPTHIHGITNKMAARAPTFDQIAGPLAAALDGTILAAHNLPFDGRMLKQDFARVGADFSKGWGICTYQLTKLKLSEACKKFGVKHAAQHTALGDALATTELMVKLITNAEINAEFASVENYEHLMPGDYVPIDRLQATKRLRPGKTAQRSKTPRSRAAPRRPARSRTAQRNLRRQRRRVIE